MTTSEARIADISGRKVLEREENFLGTGWWFLKAIGGNLWYHRPSGKLVLASSAWPES